MFIDTLRATLVSKAPFFIRFPIKLVPVSVRETFMTQALQAIFHEALADGDFEFLENKWLEIWVKDIEFKSYISFQNDKLVVKNQIPVAENVRFSGNLNDLILIAARKEDPDTLFFQRRLLIEGDTELGLEVKNLMDSVDLDSLPKLMSQGLFSLADFIQHGMKTQKEKELASKNMTPEQS